MLLARLMWQRLQVELRWESPDLIIPVPLHLSRLLKRRYNQSALLGVTLAQLLHRPLVTHALRRVKKTKAQTSLNLEKREENVRDAFQVVKEQVQDRAVLLVDDVFTTGATTREAVRILKQAGASRVVIACLASTQPKHLENSDDAPESGAE